MILAWHETCDYDSSVKCSYVTSQLVSLGTVAILRSVCGSQLAISGLAKRPGFADCKDGSCYDTGKNYIYVPLIGLHIVQLLERAKISWSRWMVTEQKYSSLASGSDLASGHTFIIYKEIMCIVTVPRRLQQ